MNLTAGSPLTFTSAAGSVTFTDDSETWTEALIGFSVVVTWSGQPDRQDDPADTETDVEPVFLDEGLPTTLTRYRAHHAGHITARVNLPESTGEPETWVNTINPRPENWRELLEAQTHVNNGSGRDER